MNASSSSPSPSGRLARASATTPRPAAVRVSPTDASTTTGIPKLANTWPNNAPRRSGWRSTIAISSGGTPPASSRATSPPIASVSGALQQGDAVVWLDSGSARLEEVLIEVPQRGARRVALVERKLRDGLGPRLIPQDGEELGPGREGLAVRVVHGHHDVAGTRQRGDQLELLLGEIVESVEEHRPRAPRRRPFPKAADGLAGCGMLVVSPGCVPSSLIGRVEAGQLQLVASVVQQLGRVRQLVGTDQGALELTDEAIEGRGEASPGCGRAQRSQLGFTGGGAHQCQALCGRQPGPERGAGRRGNLVAQPSKRLDRGAQHGAATGAELPLEARGVVGRGHDQYRVLAEEGVQPRLDLPGTTGVRGPDDQRERHDIQHR